ncbi:Glycerate dehydrogenase HPR, peroxisomal [Capsicum baccatum]|uniref:Glycerate dehydrogenase HPR, peroxisomal n=1 Tax=Capsicum baccatum TaxID=33114 RepID=A0A2G2WJW2_CAPBA|nr:Glycerate dehydrogenase HPR, peroxisomal [Capsicum baccatum]
MMRTVEEAEKAVVLYNRYGVLTKTTTELATSFSLAATRRIVEADEFMRAGKYEGWLPHLFVGNLLKGQTVGVIGAGRIGPAHARMMIILHPVLDKTTYHLVNKERLAMMKKEVILVNCSRGPVIDEVTLVENLRENPMFHISLDVFEDEPYMKTDLADMKNVVVVPHTTSASKWTHEGMATLAALNILADMQIRGHHCKILSTCQIGLQNMTWVLIDRHSLRLGVQLPTYCLLLLESYPYPFEIYTKIGGLPIGGLPYEEVAPEVKELTGNFREAAMMADKQTFSLAVHSYQAFIMVSTGPSIPLMTTSSGEGGAKHFDGELARKCIHQGDTAIWNSIMPNKSSPCYFVDDDKNEESEISYFMSLHFNLLPFRYGGPIVDTPHEHSEEVPVVVKDSVLKPDAVIPFRVKGPLHAETQKEKSSVLTQQAFNKRTPQDESESSHGDRCWKKVKPSLAKKCDSNTHMEIHTSSSKTPPTIEKVWPDNVQILEDPHQRKPQDSSESVVGPDSKELLLSSKKVTSNSCGLTPNRDFSIQDDVEVILNDMSGMEADISPLQDLLESFFGMATFYDQERSALVDKTTIIKESEPYLKAKEHLDLVSRERDEKSEKVSAACKSLEKARKKVKKLKAHQDAAKKEAAEMESKVLAAEEEFSKCSDVSLATTKASKVVEKKNQVLEAALQDLVNYKLYLN